MNIDQKVIKTYASIPKFVDPAHVLTMSDLNISYALASTLVEWDNSRLPTSGLSDKWDFPKSNVIRFQLKKNLKWSNGEIMTANDVCKSFDRAKRKYYDELKSLFDIVKSIKCPTADTIEFETYNTVAESNILRKLTEPMYGIVAFNEKDEALVDKTSGAYSIFSRNDKEIVMKKNLNWHKTSNQIADQVELRQLGQSPNLAEEFLTDSWANLVSINSIQKNEVFEKFEKNGFDLWRRNPDKIFFISASKRFLSSFKEKSLKSIADHIDVKSLFGEHQGYVTTKQFFPRGYILYDQHYQPVTGSKPVGIERPLKIILPNAAVALIIKDSLATQLQTITGQKPEIVVIKSNEIAEYKTKGDFDLLITNVAVDDPNYEGAMEFFFSGSAPLINSEKEQHNFVDRAAKARSLKSESERLKEFTKIMTDAIENGFVAPLFLYAHVIVGKNGVHVSQIPITKETIFYSEIRFEKK